MTIEEHLDRILARIEPVPRDVVAAMPYDAHLTAKQKRGYASTARKDPWAGSGHYGKELGLMIAGRKRVALIDDDELPIWQSSIDDHGWAVRRSMGHFLIAWPDEADLAEAVDLFEQDGGMGLGLVLGYHTEDVVAFVRRVEEYLGV